MNRDFFGMVRTKIIFLFIVAVSIMTVVFFYFSHKSEQVIYDKVTEINQNLLLSYGQIMEEKFNLAEAFLVSQRLQPSLYLGLNNESQGVENYLASFKIHEYFLDSTFGENSFDYIFAYSPESNTYVDYGYSFTDAKETAFETVFRQEFAGSHLLPEQWTVIKTEQEYSVYYMIPVYDVYIGCVIELEGLKNQFAQMQKTEEGLLFFDTEGNALQKIDGTMLTIPSSTAYTDGGTILLNNRNYLENTITICDGTLTLMRYVDQEYLSGQLEEANRIFIIFIPILLLVTITGIWVLWKSLITPLSNLMQGVEKLKEGNFSYQLKECKNGEFKKLTTAFQDMSREIWKLKIDIYEEQIQRQKTQLIFLQNQLKPHFLINCLNNLRALELTGEHEKFQSLITKVGRYMRTTLSSKGISTLEEEIQNTYNYIEIQKVRYENGFDTEITVSNDLMRMSVPVQILQCFVENAIKYQLDNENQLRIIIDIDFADEDCEFMRITILDNGKGFDREIQKKLNAGEQIKKDGRSCIGIYNVVSRLKIYYHNKAVIHFENQESMGAKIEILIPIE